MKREMDVAESFQKEIASLQRDFTDHIESGSGRNNMTSASSEGIVRDLKYQLEEKELLLEKLHQEVKDMRKDRDDAVCSKDELIASHQAEYGVSQRCIASFSNIKSLIADCIVISENYSRMCQDRSQQSDA